MQYILYAAFSRFVRVIIAFITLSVLPLSRHNHSEKRSTSEAFHRECVTLGPRELNDRPQTGTK